MTLVSQNALTIAEFGSEVCSKTEGLSNRSLRKQTWLEQVEIRYDSRELAKELQCCIYCIYTSSGLLYIKSYQPRSKMVAKG